MKIQKILTPSKAGWNIHTFSVGNNYNEQYQAPNSQNLTLLKLEGRAAATNIKILLKSCSPKVSIQKSKGMHLPYHIHTYSYTHTHTHKDTLTSYKSINFYQKMLSRRINMNQNN